MQTRKCRPSNRIIQLVLCLLCLTIRASALANSLSIPVQSLDSAVSEALRTNPSVLQAKANEEAVGYTKTEAVGGFLPSVDLHGAVGKESSVNSTTRSVLGSNASLELRRRERSVTLTEPVFSGFSTFNLVRQRQQETQSAQYQVLDENQTLAFEATQAYLDVLRLATLVQLGTNNVAAHQSTLVKSQMRYSGGASRKTDVDLAKGRLSQAEATLRSIEGNQEDAKATFTKIIGHPPAQLILPTLPTNIPKTLEEAQQIGLDNSPLLKATAAKLNASKSAVAVSKGGFLPNVDVEFSASNNDNIDGVQGSNKDVRGMLVANYNVFRGGTDFATVQEQGARRSEAMQEEDVVRRDIIENITQSWNQLQTAQARLIRLQNHVTASQEVVTGYTQQFEIGRHTLLDVLDVERELFNARVDLLNGEYEVKIATYNLLANMGTLTQQFHF